MRYLFQSTRPIRGATFTPTACLIFRCSHFNPRAPYGARQSVQVLVRLGHAISIHAPHTGRDHYTGHQPVTRRQFQSTRPIRGATDKYTGSTWDVLNFNPRAPYGARHLALAVFGGLESISIHAPHTGRDVRANAEKMLQRLFQSTRPIRGATLR